MASSAKDSDVGPMIVATTVLGSIVASTLGGGKPPPPAFRIANSSPVFGSAVRAVAPLPVEPVIGIDEIVVAS